MNKQASLGIRGTTSLHGAVFYRAVAQTRPGVVANSGVAAEALASACGPSCRTIQAHGDLVGRFGGNCQCSGVASQ